MTPLSSEGLVGGVSQLKRGEGPSRPVFREQCILCYSWNIECEGGRGPDETREVGGGQVTKCLLCHAKEFEFYPDF